MIRGHPVKISDKNRKALLQLKLDWQLKSVDEVISKLLEKTTLNKEV